MNLYQIGSAYQRLQYAEDRADFENALAVLVDQAEPKIIGLARLIKNLEAEHNAYDTEAKRLAAHARALNNRIEWVREYILSAMAMLEKDQVDGLAMHIRRRADPASVIVENPSMLPEHYIQVEISTSLDRVPADARHLISSTTIRRGQLAADIRAGHHIENVRMESMGYSLRIT